MASVASLVLAAAVIASPGAGEAAAAESSAPTLSVRWTRDVALTAALGASWALSEALLSDLAPRRCRWCSANSLDRAIGDALAWSDGGTARRLSDVSAGILAPALAAGTLALGSSRAGRIDQLPDDLLVVGQAVVLSGTLAQAVKLAVARRRPRPADSPEDDNLSFYSAHTALAFSLVVSSATVAHIRGYEQEAWLWRLGLPLAAWVGYLRMAGQRHYFTDVLAGALAGSAVGFGVPWLLHRDRAEPGKVGLALLPSGVAFRGAF